jgi:hypothetical protein
MMSNEFPSFAHLLLLIALAVLLPLSWALIVVIYGRLMSSPREWHPHIRISLTPTSLIEGKTTRDWFLMRRQTADGNWLYRRMTSGETCKYFSEP